MLAHLALAVLLAVRPAPVRPAVHAAPDPRAVVNDAIAAMQGGASLRELRSLRLTGVEHEFMLGNAERAEGPWRTSYWRFSELRDVGAPVLRRTEWTLTPDGESPVSRTYVLADSVLAVESRGRQAGLSHGQYEDWMDRVDASPARALLLASASAGLRWDRAVTRFGVTSDVVSFPWRNGRMRVEVSRESRLPVAVEVFRAYPDDFRWAPFGDVTMRFDYVDWTVQPTLRGAWWPMQEKVSFNGQPYRDVTYGSIALAADPAPADSFAVSDSARAQFAAASALNFSRFTFGARGAPTELRPGIVRVPDFWSMTLVKQPDGVVVFEAHINASYLHAVLAEVGRRWPGSKVKAIVMTSDPWAHLGGVREAMALGIPIYVNARSVPFLKSLARAPHTLEPDALARSGRAPTLVGVRGKVTIGAGPTRIELYPVGGAYAERMTMAYFPEYRLLYGADLVFPNRGPDGKFAPGFDETPATDLRRAVAREQLAVDTVFCVQNYGPFAWSAFSGH